MRRPAPCKKRHPSPWLCIWGVDPYPQWVVKYSLRSRICQAYLPLLFFLALATHLPPLCVLLVLVQELVAPLSIARAAHRSLHYELLIVKYRACLKLWCGGCALRYHDRDLQLMAQRTRQLIQSRSFCVLYSDEKNYRYREAFVHFFYSRG